jgi:hypothetical protein
MRFKLWLRKFLGTDDVPSLTMFKAMELKQKERHDELFGILMRVEQRMIIEHVGQKRDFAAPVMDWEQAQAMMLQRLEEENEPKEK